MRILLPFLAAPALLAAQPAPSDTIHLTLGSQDVDASYFQPHAAKVRVYVKTPNGEERMRAEWVNVLTLGDSAGKKVHHWVTSGTQIAANGQTTNWELKQTYDAKTLAPYGIARTASNGSASSFRIDGRNVTGWRRANATAPLWGPNMPASEVRVFTVIGEDDVNVEGTMVRAWKVEERRQSDRTLTATWWLLPKSPYMVYGEVPLADGSMQRMTEVAVPMPAKP